MNICLLRNGSVIVRISLVRYKYVPINICIVRDTYYIRIRIYAQQSKINTMMIVSVWLTGLTVNV